LQTAIAGLLEQAGYEVHTEVGAGAYRVALAVRHPEHPGRYALGIETDGMHYASGATARDREHVRQAVLAQLGWKLTRVYALDWWHDPAGEAQRVLLQLQSALQAQEEEPDVTAVAVAAPAASEPPGTLAAAGPSRPYQPCQLPPAPGGAQALTAHAAAGKLAVACLGVIAQEGPVHLDLICRRLMGAYDIKRMSDKLRHLVRDALASEHHQLVVDGPFYRLRADAEQPWEGVRSGHREPEHWPTEEVTWALTWLLSSALSLTYDEAQRELARMFGLQRGGKHVAAALQRGLKALAEGGHCREKDGLLIWELN
jgi:very-short-patch-repair endonuclease